MNTLISGNEKRDEYAMLKIRLKKALASGFWLEASIIEFAIIEDRLVSIMFYSGIISESEIEDTWEKPISKKLNRIALEIGKKQPLVSKYVSRDTIQKIQEWRELRNKAVHRACTYRFNDELFQAIAEEGRVLMDKISNDAQKISRAKKRMMEKAQKISEN